MKLQPRVSWNIDPAYYNLIKNTLYTPSKTCTYRSKSTHLSLFATKTIGMQWGTQWRNKKQGEWQPNQPKQYFHHPSHTKKGKQPRFCTSNVNDSPKDLHISKGSGISSASKKGAPKVSQKLPLWLDIVFRGVLCLWWKSTKTKFCRETTCQPTSIPEDPITETENGFMEPKYLSFWRWLYTPCSSSDKVIGSLPVGHHTKLFWIQLPTSEGKCHMSPQQM